MSDASNPNILVIMSDQHHPRFMGCAGEPIVRTPNLDRLAARGTRFSRAYCNFPLCGPSRMSFMTARYAGELECLTNNMQLGSDVPTFAHAFNVAGYETLLCGRMHFNGPDQRHGFQKRLVGDVLGAYENHVDGLKRVLGDPLRKTTGPSAEAIRHSGRGDTGYQAYDNAVTDAAAQWLTDRHAEQPFMMVVGLVLPHAPFVAPDEDYALYDNRITADDLPKPHPESLHPEMRRLQSRAGLEGAEPVSLDDQRRARVAYHGMCTFTDRCVGRILDALDAAGMTDNTIVVYTSDHGEQLGEHGMWWKHTFYEGSVGVPMIFAGPGIPAGWATSRNVSLIDVGPTLLDLAGAPAIPGASGKSFRCLLDGDTENWHDTVIAENLWPPQSDCLHRMIKQGPWKLCHYPGFEPQLFNLDIDPGETRDLAADPAVSITREELMSKLAEGWDPQAIMARHRNARTVQNWTRQWATSTDLPEPDAPWFDTPPRNSVSP